MTLADLAHRAAALAGKARAPLVPLAPLLARLVYGFAFALTGYGKLTHLDRIVAYFEGLGIPAASIQAPMIGLLELVGGAALMLGLCTRLAAFLLSCTMVVALLTADRAGFVDALLLRGDDDLTAVKPVPFLLVLLWLLAAGAGAWSADRLLAQRRASRQAGG